MVAYTRAKLLRLLKIDFVRFCIVGGTGFVINFILLVFLTKVIGLHIFIAQFIGAEIALFSNFSAISFNILAGNSRKCIYGDNQRESASF
jgi:putative flippase GtrA